MCVIQLASTRTQPSFFPSSNTTLLYMPEIAAASTPELPLVQAVHEEEAGEFKGLHSVFSLTCGELLFPPASRSVIGTFLLSQGNQSMNFKKWVTGASARRQVIVEGQVVPETIRCVQCGICSYHCPIGIDVRRHAWLDMPVVDSHGITCGECIARCPRGVLRFEKTNLFVELRYHARGNPYRLDEPGVSHA